MYVLRFNYGCPEIRTKDGKHMTMISSFHNEMGLEIAEYFTFTICKLCTMPDAEALIQLPSSMEGMVIHSQIITYLDTQELAASLELPAWMVHCRLL